MRDYFPILSRFIATLEESFNHKEVSFVVSMDNDVEKHLKKHRKDGGEFAFSLNSLCKLPNLRIQHLYDFIKVRLKEYKWQGGVRSFMTEEAFLALMLASSNHPRRAVRILAEAIKEVAMNKGITKKIIDFDSMCTAAVNSGNPLDEKDWTVLTYLQEHGQSSASDDGLRKALGFAKPKRVGVSNYSVDRRLQAIAEKLRLSFDDVSAGNTKKKVLYAPDTPNW